ASFSAEISCSALSSGVPAGIRICVTCACAAMATSRIVVESKRNRKRGFIRHPQAARNGSAGWDEVQVEKIGEQRGLVHNLAERNWIEMVGFNRVHPGS